GPELRRERAVRPGLRRARVRVRVGGRRPADGRGGGRGPSGDRRGLAGYLALGRGREVGQASLGLRDQGLVPDRPGLGAGPLEQLARLAPPEGGLVGRRVLQTLVRLHDQLEDLLWIHVASAVVAGARRARVSAAISLVEVPPDRDRR